MAIVSVGPIIVPLPEGVDLSDADHLAENIQRLAPVNFIPPWLAHALGTLVGAFVAAKLAARRPMQLALGIGAFFLVGGIVALAMIGGPIWFMLLDLIGAYVPMAYLGGVLARSRKPQPA